MLLPSGLWRRALRARTFFDPLAAELQALAGHTLDRMATSSATDLRYPVVYLSARAGVGAAQSHEELSRSHPALLRSGFFQGLRLVSADGRAFEVTEAQVVSPRSTMARWWAGTVGSPLRMRIEVRRVGDPQVAEIRALVLAEMEREPAALEELTRQPLEWWRRHLSEASSTGELVRRFAAGLAAGSYEAPFVNPPKET